MGLVRGETGNSMVNVDRDQFAILCPIILSMGAPIYLSRVDSKCKTKKGTRKVASNTRHYISDHKTTQNKFRNTDRKRDRERGIVPRMRRGPLASAASLGDSQRLNEPAGTREQTLFYRTTSPFRHHVLVYSSNRREKQQKVQTNSAPQKQSTCTQNSYYLPTSNSWFLGKHQKGFDVKPKGSPFCGV